MRTGAMVSFKRWEWLDWKLQTAALAAIKDDLGRYVLENVRELYEVAVVTVELSEASGGTLLVAVELDQKDKFPLDSLLEIIRRFLAGCQEPQLVGFELTTYIAAAAATDVVGGGTYQIYGLGPATIPVRKAF